MARSNGPFGPSGAAPRRRPGDDPFGAPTPQPGGWPPQPQYSGSAPASQPMQGYHFPPPEPDPGFGYGNQQQMPPPQWGQQQPDPQGYELSYQAYSATDPSPFANATPHQQQSYGEPEADYGEDYFDDEEPRRGRRWILIAAALVGAIGIGGALAYSYRAFIAPHSGRVPVVKADPNVKVKPDFRKEVAAERRLPSRDEQAPAAAGPSSQEEPAADGANPGPRVVRPIPIAPGGSAAAAPPAAPASSAVPGITLYQPPQGQPRPAPAAAPPSDPPAQAPARVAAPPQVQQPPPGRVVIGTRPSPSETEDTAAAAPSPVKRAVQTAALTPPPRAPVERPRESTTAGLGYVAVLSSKKSRMDALTEYADLREKFPDVLSDKTPDVQEADLSSRGLGTMYRLVVGPPGSHNSASGLCSQLKTAGYVGCWVKEY